MLQVLLTVILLLTDEQELVSSIDQLKPQIIRIIEGFETVLFKSKFDSWPQTPDVTVSEDGRGKVAGMCLIIYGCYCGLDRFLYIEFLS